jgi:hypothetical protein
MRALIKVFFLLALALISFGYFGYFTQVGSRHFDEMDGLIPFFALVAGGILLCITICGLVFYRRK